ncbi:hypothetical protein Afil01_03780 [Actinorhabdospora filicis]|uniref:Mycolysin n=1 Tax=Actinorhabdospora filicis TaxID=1785913 RepID=A0A9W6SHI0_9ACTN|nr:hypothetical protein [Actinorhabdospora filicis]GLZ75571.1 hypothetical protein Afil01_03780 [Actinorhabdospora filicis]
MFHRTFPRGALIAAVALALVAVPLAVPAAAAPACDTVVAGEKTPGCVTAATSFDRLPALGERATLRVRLGSQVEVASARLTLRLTEGLRLTGTAPARAGLTTVSTRSLTLTPRGRELSFTVEALATGPARVEAELTDAASPSPARTAYASTVLTVGDRPGTSREGADGTDSAAVPVGEAPPAPSAGAAAGQICATGAFTYADAGGAWRPGRNVPVAVLGRTTSTAAARTYATGLTNTTDGGYRVCFTPTVTTMASVWVVFTSQASVWRVVARNGSTPYTVTTAARSNVPSGTDAAFGSTAPSALHMRGWHAFDTLNKLWWWRSSGTGCWTARETANCSSVTVRWYPGSTDGTYYNVGSSGANSWIALTEEDPDSEHLVLHESGHAFQHMLYGFWWPASDCPSPHYIHKRSGNMCAWTEGFANAAMGHALHDYRFVWPGGAQISLMNTAWNDPARPVGATNWENGETVEGRVAGALIDLWDRIDGGQAPTLDNMRRYVSSSLREWFTTDRPRTGLPTGADAKGVLYEHTIAM